VPFHVPQQALALDAVTTVGSGHAWAVGESVDGPTPLILRWNGSAWRVDEAQPPRGAVVSILQGVSATSARDVWTVGWVGSVTRNPAPLVEHWDGTVWRRVPVPHGPRDTRLGAVEAVSAIDVWAVGDADGRPLVVHWDGTAWRNVRFPHVVASGGTTLSDIAMTSASRGWVVGERSTLGGARTVVARWDGSRWQLVPSPNLGGSSSLGAITAVAPDDAWAVGADTNWPPVIPQKVRPLIEHWDGKAWRLVELVGVRPDGGLLSITHTPSGDLWVGAANHTFGHMCPDST
jgi:hypothetical protein